MDTLPKGRAIPIRGDAVRTLRIKNGWASPGTFADAVPMSEDRLIEIEKGGGNVFARTLMAIAKTLEVEWRELVNWPAVEGGADATAPSLDTQQKKRMEAKFVFSGNINELDHVRVSDLVRKMRELTGVEGEFIVITVEEAESFAVTLDTDREDLLKLIAAFLKGELASLGLKEIRLPSGGFGLWPLFLDIYLHAGSEAKEGYYPGLKAEYATSVIGSVIWRDASQLNPLVFQTGDGFLHFGYRDRATVTRLVHRIAAMLRNTWESARSGGDSPVDLVQAIEADAAFDGRVIALLEAYAPPDLTPGIDAEGSLRLIRQGIREPVAVKS